MSRVFEALSKASAEKNRHAGSVTTASPLPRPVPLEPFTNRSHISHNGAAPANDTEESSALPEHFAPTIPDIATTSSQKSWRERLEELLFGWDIARYKAYPIVAMEQDSPAAEQYKILREQIKRFRNESSIQIFTVTSPVKKDGKTTVAVNLSVALALDYERKVLLIDGDLRAPGVHRYFDAPQSPGLADHLSANVKTNIRSIVRETFLPGLRILPAGRSSHFASELLAKEKMKNVMAEVRQEFSDYQIIIDSPPILSTPDPLVIAGHVDGVLLVVRAGKTPRDYLNKALQTLNSTKVMGVVLNSAEMGLSSKYYYYAPTND